MERKVARAFKKLVRIGLLFVCVATLLGCEGPGHVQFDGGRCLRDGRALTVDEVEADQARVAQRIASRQPWFAVITIGVVLLAAAGNAEKALLLVRARHEVGHRPLAERLRDMLAGHRDSPARFAAIIGTSLGLILLCAVGYIYLDIDKRASERALATLQFCHLALRTQEEEKRLDEQRHNLDAIQSTAGDIRTLVNKLPPDEQKKAQVIVDQMNVALTKQGKIVGDYAARADEAEKGLSERTLAMEKGIASVEGDLASLRALPASLRDLETATHKIDQTTSSYDARFDDVHARIAALDAKLDALLAKPACAAAPRTAEAKAATSASASPPPPPTSTPRDAGSSGP